MKPYWGTSLGGEAWVITMENNSPTNTVNIRKNLQYWEILELALAITIGITAIWWMRKTTKVKIPKKKSAQKPQPYDYRKRRVSELLRAIANTNLEIEKLARDGIATDGWHANRIRNLETQLEILQQSLDRSDGKETEEEFINLTDVVKAINEARDTAIITLTTLFVGSIILIAYIQQEQPQQTKSND